MNKFDLLPAYIAGGRSFAWGTNDCCTFAADWLVVLGKPDPMEGVRGTYQTAKEAMRLYRAGLLDRVTERLGEPMDNPLCAQRGDIAVVEMANGREAAGVVAGEFVAVPGHNGLGFLPLTAAVAAWRV
jgi:hypothetical protein